MANVGVRHLGRDRKKRVFAFQAKTRMFQELIGTGVVPLRSGVLRVVDEAIGAGVPLAVCSTSNEAAVRTLVQTLMGEERYAKFDFYCGDAVPRKKPQPDVYLLAAEKLKVEPRRCVVIEDSGIGLKVCASYNPPPPPHPPPSSPYGSYAHMASTQIVSTHMEGMYA